MSFILIAWTSGMLVDIANALCARVHYAIRIRPCETLLKQISLTRTIEVAERALIGLQRIYHDIHAKPRSEGQASALRLVHYPSSKRPLVIVLPTSSGKFALFFSVAAMTDQQTVVVMCHLQHWWMTFDSSRVGL